MFKVGNKREDYEAVTEKAGNNLTILLRSPQRSVCTLVADDLVYVILARV